MTCGGNIQAVEVQVGGAQAHLAIGTMHGMMPRIMHRLTDGFPRQLVAEMDNEFVAWIDSQRRRLQPAIAPITVADQTMSVLRNPELEGEFQPPVLAVQFRRLLNNRARRRTRTSVVASAPLPRFPYHDRDTRQ